MTIAISAIFSDMMTLPTFIAEALWRIAWRRPLTLHWRYIGLGHMLGYLLAMIGDEG